MSGQWIVVDRWDSKSSQAADSRIPQNGHVCARFEARERVQWSTASTVTRAPIERSTSHRRYAIFPPTFPRQFSIQFPVQPPPTAFAVAERTRGPESSPRKVLYSFFNRCWFQLFEGCFDAIRKNCVAVFGAHRRKAKGKAYSRLSRRSHHRYFRNSDAAA